MRHKKRSRVKTPDLLGIKSVDLMITLKMDLHIMQS